VNFENAVENEHLRFEITKAQLTGNRFNVILAASKYYLPFPVEHKETKMKEFIIDHFMKKANININSGHFCRRIDAGLCSEPGRVYENKYLIFGVDLLTTKKIMTRYSRYSPLLKWVDASHCILEFPSIQLGWEFLKFQVLNFEI
jgi:hypothetical protein